MARLAIHLAACLLALWPVVLPADPPQRPNILIITADNLGYGDLPCFHADSEILTPRLDRLAAEGMRLTAFYTASPTCTVSRACLLTGRVAARHGLTNQLPGLKGNYGSGLDRGETLIPEVLQRAEYATGCFGKWNIGFAPGSRPTERGFDEFIGHASGNMDYYHHEYNGRHDLYRGTEQLHVEGTYSTDLFADAAIDFIAGNHQRQRPWFCYLPFNAPHFPNAKNKRSGQPNIWQAPARAFEAYGWSPDETDPRKRYAAVVTALDQAIGRLLDSLDRLEISERTFVFFFSDNGAFRLGRAGIDIGSNFPLRDGGVTCWEGGIRVPAIARWPGQITAGSQSDHPLWSPDLMIAAARLSGAALPSNIEFDGIDPLPVLRGESSSSARPLYFTFRDQAALRMGRWKIIREKPDRPWQLYQLIDDPSESTDLAEMHPDVVDQLAQTFDAYLE